MNTVIVAFYQFTDLPDYRELRAPLLDFCRVQQVKGSILLAAEGVNGTIAGARSGVDAVLAYLRRDPRLATMPHKESFADFTPFGRMKVRLKKEIVALGEPQVSPNDAVGEYVPPQAWNALISDPDVLLIDTRNGYEIQVGTFRGAVNPETESFRQFPEFVQQNLDPTRHKKVAMFCTGGIRCEKATAYLLQQGFSEVYHLQGGILNYLQQVPAEKSLWQGECFVFDERGTVNHDLQPGAAEFCPTCQAALDAAAKASPLYEAGVCCSHCRRQLTAAQLASAREKEKQRALAARRQEGDAG